jgi:hypothetical protein
MTPQNEEHEKEGILEQMLRRLALIGQNVERIMYRCGFYSTGEESKNDDEWSANELYSDENGDY